MISVWWWCECEMLGAVMELEDPNEQDHYYNIHLVQLNLKNNVQCHKRNCPAEYTVF